MQDFYKQDLAYIHDTGYGEHARKSAVGILDILSRLSIHDGLIVDLGCGSGISALEFVQKGYQVLGIDISGAMVALAKEKVPQAEFRVASLFKVDLPSCRVVTSIGECLNYLFDPNNNQKLLQQFFARVYQTLTTGGVFIFDILEPGQVTPNNRQRFTEGKDWIVLVEKEENSALSTLTRRIVTLRKSGDQYRRDDEVHHVQLYRSVDITHRLRQVGFKVQVMRGYGKYKLAPGHTVFVARKPLL